MRRMTPTEGLTAVFLIGLILLTLIFKGRIPHWYFLILCYLALMGVLVGLKLSRGAQGVRRVIATFYPFSPILFVILIYQSLGELIQHLRPDVDPWLIQIDLFIFGVHPTVWMERWIVPWFTDLMSLAYISYYFLPVILIVTLYLRGRMEAFHLSVFTLTLGYYLSYVGYILFPAIGPRYTLTAFQSVPLEASVITDFVRDVLNALEHNKRDCMPSGHTQIALMVLWLARRYERPLFYILLPIVSGLILSTVYLRYHYVIDLFAGAGFALGCLIIAPRLYRMWKVESGK